MLGRQRPRSGGRLWNISVMWGSTGRRIQRSEEARAEYERIWSQLGIRTIEDLIDMPFMTDPAVLATLDVLTRLLECRRATCDDEFEVADHLPGGECQPRARQQRRLVRPLAGLAMQCLDRFGDYAGRLIALASWPAISSTGAD